MPMLSLMRVVAFLIVCTISVATLACSDGPSATDDPGPDAGSTVTTHSSQESTASQRSTSRSRSEPQASGSDSQALTREQLLVAVDATLATMHPEFKSSFDPEGVVFLSHRHLLILLRILEELPDQGSDVGSALAYLHSSMVDAGVSVVHANFGLTQYLADELLGAFHVLGHYELAQSFDSSAFVALHPQSAIVLYQAAAELITSHDDASQFAIMEAVSLAAEALQLPNEVGDFGASALHQKLREPYLDAIALRVAAMPSDFADAFNTADLSALSIPVLEQVALFARRLDPAASPNSLLAALERLANDAIKLGMSRAQTDFGRFEYLVSLNAPTLNAIEATLTAFEQQHIFDVIDPDIDHLHPDVLEAVHRHLVLVLEQGFTGLAVIEQLSASLSVAGVDTAPSDLGFSNLKTVSLAGLKAVLDAIDSSIYFYADLEDLMMPTVSPSAIEAMAIYISEGGNTVRSRLDGTALLFQAALAAGLAPEDTNVGLARAVSQHLERQFLTHPILGEYANWEAIANYNDATALAILSAFRDIREPQNNPLITLRAISDAAVASGVPEDNADIGVNVVAGLFESFKAARVEAFSNRIRRSSGQPPTFLMQFTNNYWSPIRAIRIAIHAYDGFGRAFGGGCIPYPSIAEYLLAGQYEERVLGRRITLTWWWEERPCTDRAERFDLRILEVSFLDGTYWRP